MNAVNSPSSQLVECGIGKGFVDVWEATGKRPELKYTWDMVYNDNLQANFGRYRPRCRFDRIYYRDSKPSQFVPVNLNLLGLKRLTPHVCFPSDHWGLLAHFQPKNPQTLPQPSTSSANGSEKASGDSAGADFERQS